MMLFMKDKFLKSYSPNETEQSIYELWEKSGYFNPDNLPGEQKESFTIVLPPPNVTGVLHLGHAYEDSLQDAVIRYQRMRGKRALWIPGTDSAAIATQARVEKNIQKDEGKSRHDLGREELIRRIWQWKERYGNRILDQLKGLGASCDWDRTRFTLDEGLSHAVRECFVTLYNRGLIYRGKYIVHWCPRCQTALSDEEAVHQD